MLKKKKRALASTQGESRHQQNSKRLCAEENSALCALGKVIGKPLLSDHRAPGCSWYTCPSPFCLSPPIRKRPGSPTSPTLHAYRSSHPHTHDQVHKLLVYDRAFSRVMWSVCPDSNSTHYPAYKARQKRAPGNRKNSPGSPDAHRTIPSPSSRSLTGSIRPCTTKNEPATH